MQPNNTDDKNTNTKYLNSFNNGFDIIREVKSESDINNMENNNNDSDNNNKDTHSKLWYVTQYLESLDIASLNSSKSSRTTSEEDSYLAMYLGIDKSIISKYYQRTRSISAPKTVLIKPKLTFVETRRRSRSSLK